MSYHLILIRDGFLESEFTRIPVMKNVTASGGWILNLKFGVKFSTYTPEFTVLFLSNKFYSSLLKSLHLITKTYFFLSLLDFCKPSINFLHSFIQILQTSVLPLEPDVVFARELRSAIVGRAQLHSTPQYGARMFHIAMQSKQKRCDGGCNSCSSYPTGYSTGHLSISKYSRQIFQFLLASGSSSITMSRMRRALVTFFI